MKTTSLIWLIVICAVLDLCRSAIAVSPSPTVVWSRQFGTPKNEGAGQIEINDLGDIFITGRAESNIDGPPGGTPNIFIRKYDAAGSVAWTRQMPQFDDVGSNVLAADTIGNVILGGDTEASIAAPNVGLTDVVLRKYDSTGAVLWTRQEGSGSYDTPTTAVTDAAGNFYLTGYTGGNFAGSPLGSYDAFLVKYDPLGNRIWARQFGTSTEDYGSGVAIDALGGVYVAGHTNGALGGPLAGGSYDMFLAKYDSNGNAVWKRQLGTSSQDGGYDVATDSVGNAYLLGYTEGVMAPGGAGGGDVVLINFDPAGNIVWTRQFGTSTQDLSGRISADPFGDLYLSGVTYGSLGGPSNGALEAFVAKYFTNGTADWIYQVGTPATDYGTSVAPDGFGNLYFSGMTEGALAGPSAGAADGFLIKLRDNTFVPEPHSLVPVWLASLFILHSPRRRVSSADNPARWSGAD